MPPLSLLWAGREAVLLFFVLSGFVLALGFDTRPARRPRLLPFAAKPAVRLLLPCAPVAAILGLLVPLAGVLVCLVEMRFVGTDLLTTLLFMPHFVLGAVLARHRDASMGWVLRRRLMTTVALWLLCYALLTFRWLVPIGRLVCDLANGLGAGLLIALILGSPRVAASLEAHPLLRLGTISYSL